MDNNKLLKIFTTSKNIQKEIANEDITLTEFYNRVNSLYTFKQVNTRDDAWNIYHDFPELSIFSRVTNIPYKSVKTYLISIVISDTEIVNKYEVNGVRAIDLVKYINMPFINVTDIKNKLKRLGCHHTIQQSRENRKIGNDAYVSNKDKVSLAHEKAVTTNLERYGYETPLLSETVSKKSRNTILEKYNTTHVMKVSTIKQKALKSYHTNRVAGLHNNMPKVDNPILPLTSIDIENLLDYQDKLFELLTNKFKNRSTYSYTFLSEVLGISYTTIVRRINPNIIPINRHAGSIHEKTLDYLTSLGFKEGDDFIVNDRKSIAPLEIDFYFPKQNVGIEVNDIATHNTTINVFGSSPKPKNYHMEKSRLAKEKGIRLIHAWEHYFNNEQQYRVLQNAIKHALGLSEIHVYARNTYVKEVPNVSLKSFFNENNIQGFRGAKTAYALFDKKTDEVLMAYSVGASHFAHNNYDLELIRGASKLDTTIVGGASKLWKFIIDSNPDVNSIVYYIDRNIYNGSSIGSLEGNLELVNTQPGFWNYFVETGEMKNRQPGKHKEIKELISHGKVWEVYNAGTETYVWKR